MKVFEFNPTTGKRGEQIDNIKRASWTGCSLSHAISTGYMLAIDSVDVTLPKRSGQSWTAHVDAGASDAQGEHVSYLRDDWICFCLGEFRTGPESGVWEWVVLPPKQDLDAAKDAADYEKGVYAPCYPDHL